MKWILGETIESEVNKTRVSDHIKFLVFIIIHVFSIFIRRYLFLFVCVSTLLQIFPICSLSLHQYLLLPYILKVMLLILPLVISRWSGLQDVSESFWILVFSDLSNSSWIDLKTSSKPGSGNTDTNLTATRSLRLSSSASENHPVLYCQQNIKSNNPDLLWNKGSSKFYAALVDVFL